MSNKSIFQANDVIVFVVRAIRFILLVSFTILAFVFDMLANICKGIKGACERK